MQRAGAGTPRGRAGPGSPGKGSRAATHLSELEGGDDGDNDAHETDVEPIPVGQAGIGLSLQELEQHHPGRRHAAPCPGSRRRRRCRLNVYNYYRLYKIVVRSKKKSWLRTKAQELDR